MGSNWLLGGDISVDRIRLRTQVLRTRRSLPLHQGISSRMAVVTLPHTLTDSRLLSSLVLASPVPHPHSLARTHHPTATSSVIVGGRLLTPTSLARPWLVAWVLACSSRVLTERYSHIQVPQYLTFVPGCDTSYHQTINPGKLCCNVEATIWKRNHPTRSHTSMTVSSRTWESVAQTLS